MLDADWCIGMAAMDANEQGREIDVIFLQEMTSIARRVRVNEYSKYETVIA
jgi:hypothetical protein